MTKIAAGICSVVALGIGWAMALAHPGAVAGFWGVFGLGILVPGGAVWMCGVAVGTALDRMRAKAYAYRSHARQIIHYW
jgi:hypothetical protein